MLHVSLQAEPALTPAVFDGGGEPRIRILHSFAGLAPRDRGACAAIGNFDGVHLGHRSVIEIARAAARQKQAPLGVVTFEPHPRALFAPNAAPFRLTNPRTRAGRLDRLGIDRLYQLPFDRAMAALSPEDFARRVICEGLGLRHVVVGANFRFGKGRAGDTETLRALGERFGFGVSVAELRHDPTVRVSSTAIRQALSAGRPRDAARLLGQWHRLEGRLRSHGIQSHSLTLTSDGVPTADIMLPRSGQYSVRIQLRDRPDLPTWSGVAAISPAVCRASGPVRVALTVFCAARLPECAPASVALLDYHG